MDHEVGRFWSVEPAPERNRLPLTVHRYLYASLSPINRADPEGLMDIGVASFGACFAIVSSVMNGIGRLWGNSTFELNAPPELEQAGQEGQKVARVMVSYAQKELDDPVQSLFEILFGRPKRAVDRSEHRKLVEDSFDLIESLLAGTIPFGKVNKGLRRTRPEYAEVRYGDGLRIYLRDSFPEAPPYRKGMVIIHELRHELGDLYGTRFGTFDYAYGADECVSLAANSPGVAAANPDNYAWYAYIASPY